MLLNNIGLKRTGYKPVIQSVTPVQSQEITSNTQAVTSNNEPVTT